MFPSALEISLSSAIALAVVLLVYLLLDKRSNKRQFKRPSENTSVQSAAFLFADQKLIDATGIANRLLENKFDRMSNWDALMLLLQDDFPNLEDDLLDLEADMEAQFFSLFDHNLRLMTKLSNGRLKLELKGIDPHKTPELLQKLEQRGLRLEMDMLRSVADTTPQLIWQEDTSGTLTWCNKSYLRYIDRKSDRGEDETQIWPAEKLFPEVQTPDNDASSALKSRHTLKFENDNAEYWFNVASFPTEEGTIHFASDANDEMRSERSQKAFIQTFAKTFAQLSVGLAIFDKSRNLTMFNPALHEMTELPISFLSARPSIDSLFDRMRAIGRLPEPKDYSSWRDQFAKLMDQSCTNCYQETWALPDGHVYRVTGRPHPDGAFAFLFEDISAEVSLSRRFRTEIETSQAVLDTLAEPVAVFSPAQTLVVTNLSYSELWNDPNELNIAAPDLKGALRCWKSKSAPTALWSKIEAFAVQIHNRSAWEDDFVLTDGRVVKCFVSPLAGGMLMVKFTSNAITHRAQKKIRLSKEASLSQA